MVGDDDRLVITGTVEAFGEKISARTAIQPITVKVDRVGEPDAQRIIPEIRAIG